MSDAAHTPSADQIDRAARYLRETQQGGKKLTPWEQTPKATKRKWVNLAAGTLLAALAPGTNNAD